MKSNKKLKLSDFKLYKKAVVVDLTHFWQLNHGTRRLEKDYELEELSGYGVYLECYDTIKKLGVFYDEIESVKNIVFEMVKDTKIARKYVGDWRYTVERFTKEDFDRYITVEYEKDGYRDLYILNGKEIEKTDLIQHIKTVNSNLKLVKNKETLENNKSSLFVLKSGKYYEGEWNNKDYTKAKIFKYEDLLSQEQKLLY